MSTSESPGSLAQKRILLAVTGSIAAYKAPLLFRLLQKSGATVEVLLSESAQRFIGAATFSGFGATVHTDMWRAKGELHIELGQKFDAIVIAPATADCIARLAQGRSNDLLSATVLATRAPVFLAPALHPAMWSNPATCDNVRALKARGARFLGPATGPVASGDSGEGRLEEPENIAAALALALSKDTPLRGRHLVVTAGPTKERLDPVRALTNESSGKMGFAVAEQAARRGARVTLIAGPVSLPTPALVERIDIESAIELGAAIDRALGPELNQADALIMAAAVADYRPEKPSESKLKRSHHSLTLELTANPDLLATLGKRRTAGSPLLVGFALETAIGDSLITLGRQKLIDKRVDLVVANSASESLGLDENRVYLISAQDCRPLELLPKPVVAAHILDWLETRLRKQTTEEATA